VKLDPEDLSVVYLPSSQGFLEIPNISADRLLVQTATIKDLEAQTESDRVSNVRRQTKDDQAKSDFVGMRNEEDRLAGDRKAEAIATQKAKPNVTPEGIRDAQRREAGEQLQRAADRAARTESDPLAQASREALEEHSPQRDEASPGDLSTPSQEEGSIEEITRRQLDNFWKQAGVAR
jgi:hypothetical protein